MLKGLNHHGSAENMPGEVLELLGEVRELCGRAVRPIDDQRSTARYRRGVAVNLTEGFLRNELIEAM